MRRIIRRLGTPPKRRGSADNGTCPDIFELDNGEFAFMGTVGEPIAGLPELGPGQTVVILDRRTVMEAREDIRRIEA